MVYSGFVIYLLLNIHNYEYFIIYHAINKKMGYECEKDNEEGRMGSVLF